MELKKQNKQLFLGAFLRVDQSNKQNVLNTWNSSSSYTFSRLSFT